MEIKKVKLKTGKLKEMKKFYREVLTFSLLNETETSFQVAIGTSLIEFSNKEVVEQPFYHFACDIPAHQFKEAKLWIQNKTKLLTEDEADEVYFKFIDANSFYFTDPSNNIIEFIARNNIYPKSEHAFTIQSLQKLSEVGLVVEQKLEAVRLLNLFNLVNREPGMVIENSLSFFGDHINPVYLLLVNEGRKWLFSSKKSTCFPIQILLDSNLLLSVTNESKFTIEKRADEM